MKFFHHTIDKTVYFFCLGFGLAMSVIFKLQRFRFVVLLSSLKYFLLDD